MVSKRLPNIARGRMTEADKDEIVRLAETMKKPTPGKIASAINRHPATVNWFMLTRGLVERKAGHAPSPYTRNGKTIYPYSDEQDAFIQQLRIEQLSFKEIASRVTETFGIYRNHHSVQVRLVQLAAAPSEEFSS